MAGRHPYIKPTRYKHDSGFRCFEVGYCELDAKNNAIKVEVLGRCSDHILLKSVLDSAREISLDLTTNGYIRIYGLDTGNYKWRDKIIYSTVRLEHESERS
jgi:hypothetical protein